MKAPPIVRLDSLLSRRAGLVPPGQTRLVQQAALPIHYNFGGGLPDPDSFPYADLVRATEKALDLDGPSALSYGALQGYEGLRDLIVVKGRLFEGDELSPDEIFVTNGSSQAVGIIADAFLDEGDTIITESPSFGGSLGIFRKHGARIVGVPVDGDGMLIDRLEETLRGLEREGVRPKLLYTIPTFQNPSGPTLSLERRKAMIGLAAKYGFVIVEDDAYGELRFEGKTIKSLYSLAESGLVLRLGTLSKILAAGTRLGWILAPADFVPRLMAFKQDWGTNPFVSRIATYYLRDHLQSHVSELIGIYRQKRDTMLAGLKTGLGESASWNHPDGGFFLWLRLPEETSVDRLIGLAQEQGVNFAPGRNFFPDPNDPEAEKFIRLAYSYASLAAIEEGTNRLCEAISLARA